jgi:hypothetical protein
MGQALTGAMNRPVRFREVAVPSNPDISAMWRFLRGAGYQADIAALRRDYRTVGWTTFTAWAQHTFQDSDPATVLSPHVPQERS